MFSENIIKLDEIVEQWQSGGAFDVPLWSSLYEARPALTDVSDLNLKARLAEVKRNILFLNDSPQWIESLGPDEGRQSPWC